MVVMAMLWELNDEYDYGFDSLEDSSTISSSYENSFLDYDTGFFNFMDVCFI